MDARRQRGQSTTFPQRGEVWWAVLDPVEGTEMGGHIIGEPRPVLVVSDDEFNSLPLRKVVAVPLTTVSRDYPTRVTLSSRGPRRSYIACEDVRSISATRLRERAYPAPIPAATMANVEAALRLLLAL